MSKHKRGGELSSISSTLAKNKRLEPTNHDWIWWSLRCQLQCKYAIISDGPGPACACAHILLHLTKESQPIRNYHEICEANYSVAITVRIPSTIKWTQPSLRFLLANTARTTCAAGSALPFLHHCHDQKAKGTPKMIKPRHVIPTQHSIVVVYVYFICQHFPTTISPNM